MRCRRIAAIAVLVVASAVQTADPTDNPIATFYNGPDGYPAWTDSVNWKHVINMKEYKKGKNDYEKFENAQKEASEGGGVLYYPAGTYDFTTKDPGRGLMLVKGVVIRGEAPKGHPIAADGKLDLPTKFLFKFRGCAGGEVPGDWNIIGMGLDDYRDIKGMDHLGLAWVHLVGATVAFGPQFDWSKSWGIGKSLLSDKVKQVGWEKRYGEGTHPIDVLMGGGKDYKGGTHGRFVFGCEFDDAAVLDDFTNPGYGTNGFTTSRYCARIIAYGLRIFVANNLIPHSTKTFSYRQRTSINKGEKETSVVHFDYGQTIGIDINKELFSYAPQRQNDPCAGYFEQGVVVRDNWVYNHGHTGYSISGNWVTIANNHNERVVLRPQGVGSVVTLDGWEAAKPDSDNRSRAFDLAGRNLWIDHNRSNNTGSAPGNDKEAIAGRPFGTPIYSWAITYNDHKQGNGTADSGFMGSVDVDCHGLLIGWNKTNGAVGITGKRKDVKVIDCVVIAKKGDRVLGNVTTPSRAVPPPPTKVKAAIHDDDAIKITWEASEGAAGFRVERRIGNGKWQIIAYRPPHSQSDEDNPAMWVDFTAPTGKELTYRVVAVNADDNDKGASEPTEPITLPPFNG